MDYSVVGAGAGVAVLLLVVGVVLLWRRRRSAGVRQSKRAHDAATEREPPVELGETYEFGVTEFTDHHSGDRVAVGKVEGFVVFAEDIPNGVSEGDVIRATVTSFNRDETSADAIFEAAADHDILVLGETEPSIVEHIIGTVPSQVIDRTDKPVLVVRKTG